LQAHSLGRNTSVIKHDYDLSHEPT
jgi:hypothetical protein